MIIAPENSISKLSANETGKISVIMSGVHGNETAGIHAMLSIINDLKIRNGTVYFIFANLKAIKQNVRQAEKNMNRSFVKKNTGTTYEDQRACEIMEILDQADYLLDLHSSTNEKSQPFLISEYPELAKIFPVKIICSGFDKLHPGGSDGYMNSLGKVGLCIESGSIQANNTQVLKDSVLNFLKFTQNIDGEVIDYAQDLGGQQHIHFDHIHKTKTDHFRLSRKFGDFDTVKRGEVIALDGVQEIQSDRDGIIVFAHDRDEAGQEGFVLGSFEDVG